MQINKPKTIGEWFSITWKALLIIGLIWFALSQFLMFKWRYELLSDPCDYCLELNPHMDLCPNELAFNGIQLEPSPILLETSPPDS